jgi:succinoglycan biosynthesis protein ExoW
MITVVIPFYQRQPGLLQRSLCSVFAQRDVDKGHVLVVDDDSPVSATSEVNALAEAPKFPVQIISQDNAGPGAARNRALDNLPPETRYVAFLDSDDEWSENHLANAVRALGAGHDVYFADLLHVGATVSAHRRRSRLDLAQHPAIDEQGVLRTYRGDMFNQIMMGNVIGTPTVVFDATKFRDVRFRPELRSAGEDYLFWMELATRGGRFAFSTAVEAKCGSGVNVYSGSGWGTDGHPLRIHNEISYRKMTSELFRVSVEQQRFLDTKIHELREVFILDLTHRVRHRKPLPWAVIRAQIEMDPLTLFWLFPTMAKAMLRKRESGT